MAELLCGAIPGICGTVAMRPRGINGGIGKGAAGILGAGRKIIASPY